MSASTTELTDDDLLTLSPSLRELARRGMPRVCRRGYLLIQEGDLSDSIFIVVSGRIRVYSAGDAGREVTYGTYGPGEYVGEMSLDGAPRSANVVALETVRFVQITKATLLDHLRQRPEFALEVISKVIRRARAATLSARQLALNDVYGRLVQLLHSMAAPGDDGNQVIAGRVTHQELAGLLGCSREMVGRLMRDLERGQYIARRQQQLHLLRPLPSRW